MATHNEVRIYGIVSEQPEIFEDETHTQVFVPVRTLPREQNQNTTPVPTEILLFFDDNENEPLLNDMAELEPGDVVNIKGSFCVLVEPRISECPKCHSLHVKENAVTCFVYPHFLHIVERLPDDEDTWLQYLSEYQEISTQVLIIGTVMKEPVRTATKELRYTLKVDRQYYIPTQDDIHDDWPVVYTQGKQADADEEYIHKGAVILVNGYIRTRIGDINVTCDGEINVNGETKICGEQYILPDQVISEIVAYTVEYLDDSRYNENAVRDQWKEAELTD